MNERMTKLEIRMAFLEKTLEDLDGVVRDQSAQLDALRREVKSLREERVPSELPPPEAEVPPHY
jgi:uncharacterized coiled-coil protein SlyX